MSVFDPYNQNQPVTPGLNTGSATQLSTMTPVDLDGIRTNQYRSGALSALAPFLGWCAFILAAFMGFSAIAATSLCNNGLDAAACSAQNTLWLVPVGVLVVGLMFAGIGGSLAKRRRAFPSLVVLIAGFALLGLATTTFATMLGLPFP